MHLLRNQKNAKAAPGVPMPGDVLVNESFRKAYWVDNKGEHRRMNTEDTAEAVRKVKEALQTKEAAATAKLEKLL